MCVKIQVRTTKSPMPYICMVHESFTPPPPVYAPPPPLVPPQTAPNLHSSSAASRMHSRTGGAHTRRGIHKAVHTKGGL